MEREREGNQWIKKRELNIIYTRDYNLPSGDISPECPSGGYRPLSPSKLSVF